MINLAPKYHAPMYVIIRYIRLCIVQKRRVSYGNGNVLHGAVACNEQQLNVVQSCSVARNAEIIVGCWPLHSHMLICNCRQLSFCPEKSGPA